MQDEDKKPVIDGPAIEAGVASSSTAVDVDLSPPKKRIKSAQASRRASVDPGSLWNDSMETEGSSSVKVEEIKAEPERATGILEGSHTENVLARSTVVKSEPRLLDPPASSAARTSVSPSEAEIASAPPVKKKKTASTSASTKRESSSTSSSSTKAKKSSSSAKKASSSDSPLNHFEPTLSRNKAKVEVLSPPSTTTTIKATGEEDEEEDNALYCICQRRQDDVEGGMIMCDRCEQWYHYRCMRITEDDAELVDQFICPPCHEVTGESTTYKEACARQGCRRAAMKPFSRFCSDRCGVLAVTGNMASLRVEKNEGAVVAFEEDKRVAVARKTEGLTERTDKYWGVWKDALAEEMGSNLGVTAYGRRLGLAGTFALMVNGDSRQADKPAAANAMPDGTAEPAPNGTSAQPSPSPTPAAHQPPISFSSSAETSSATSTISIAEQLHLVTDQIFAVDLEKSRLNARLDRLDLRSILLHLVSDRVPTLPPVGSSSNTAENVDGEDEEMPDEPTASKKASKKKKSLSKSKSKLTADASGPRCGYDARLHWDDSRFDTWAQSKPGLDILSSSTPLDGSLDNDDEDNDDDNVDGGVEAGENVGGRVICGMAKRKCRRHIDWSNLCELALDAEKANLNADSRVLTQLKLTLTFSAERLRDELEAVRELVEVQNTIERQRRENRDREIALQLANLGTRRGVSM
ncbi:uncharacterized protein UTRI_00511 [Ustilago trichophora]|uniref:PHD-type domain-containing protein n=1 Tax=Ustilago trichophora TaxID=86804 RepID=A0A5C3DRJ0_9BASI|nr:uncharacterized protein UTRI_00511 [Ustilago trichophora]